MRYQGVLLVGGSGAGKSTVRSLLRRRFADADDIAFPRRFVTRAARADDDPEENVVVTEQQLDEFEHAERILFRWTKKLGTDRVAHYAFERSGVPFVVLGGNDALLLDETKVRPFPNPVKAYLRVLVSASPEIRRKRLSRRSPELAQNGDELQVRLADNESRLRPMVDLIINNSGGDPERNATELLRMIDLRQSGLR